MNFKLQLRQLQRPLLASLSSECWRCARACPVAADRAAAGVRCTARGHVRSLSASIHRAIMSTGLLEHGAVAVSCPLPAGHALTPCADSDQPGDPDCPVPSDVAVARQPTVSWQAQSPSETSASTQQSSSQQHLQPPRPHQPSIQPPHAPPLHQQPVREAVESCTMVAPDPSPAVGGATGAEASSTVNAAAAVVVPATTIDVALRVRRAGDEVMRKEAVAPDCHGQTESAQSSKSSACTEAAAATSDGSGLPQYFVAVDFEATCAPPEAQMRRESMEIIEFPWACVSLKFSSTNRASPASFFVSLSWGEEMGGLQNERTFTPCAWTVRTGRNCDGSAVSLRAALLQAHVLRSVQFLHRADGCSSSVSIENMKTKQFHWS
eukprot:SAG11_NODE_2447_length_3350_cov_1.723162_1_plen_379_part_00